MRRPGPPHDPRPARGREAGMTLLEVTIGVAITISLIGVVLMIGVETTGFVSYADEDFNAQMEADRAFTRMAELLRKSGRSTAGGVGYPGVQAGGAEIDFRLLDDLDGNGFPFDATTGDLEWSNEVLTIARDPATRTLFVYDGATPVWTLGRSIESVSFETDTEEPALHRKEVRLRVTSSRVARDGNTISYTIEGSIHMRN